MNKRAKGPKNAAANIDFIIGNITQNTIESDENVNNRIRNLPTKKREILDFIHN